MVTLSVTINYYHFDDGIEHIPKEHPYANDLDIFGRASLFQYINRTTSEPGSKKLAEFLKAAAPISVISEIGEECGRVKERWTEGTAKGRRTAGFPPFDKLRTCFRGNDD